MAAIGKRRRETVLKDLLKDFLHCGIKPGEEDALSFYIEEFLGIRIPKVSVCANHQAPFDFVKAAFFEEFRSAILMGARLSGKTLLMAILNHLDSMIRGRMEIVHTGASLYQANRGYRYYVESFANPLVSDYLIRTTNSRSVSYNAMSQTWNGSLVGITAGTMRGLNSAHGQRVRVDEVEVISSWEILQEAMSISHSTDRVQAQDIYASTRKRASGIMQRLLNEAEDRNMKVFSFCVFEVVEKCERLCIDDKMYGTCPILNLCKGRAHYGNGWLKIDDLISKARSMSQSTFAAQWECRKPSDAQQVFGNYYYEDVHVVSKDSNGRFQSLKEAIGVTEIPIEWRRVGGMDFGHRFCFLQCAIHPRLDVWIVEFEYFYEGDRLMRTHAENIKEKAPGWPRRLPIYADPAGKQERLELVKQFGIKTLPAIKSVFMGVDTLKQYLTISPILGKPKLYIMESCTRLRMELETWSHPNNPDGTPNLEEFEDGPDDALDSLRYAVHSYSKTHLSQVRPMTVEGI